MRTKVQCFQAGWSFRHPQARLGLNPGELLDFGLGWTTLDIFADDLEARESKETLDQRP